MLSDMVLSGSNVKEFNTDYIVKWLPILIKDYNVANIEFSYVDSDDRFQFKNGPGKPEIIFS